MNVSISNIPSQSQKFPKKNHIIYIYPYINHIIPKKKIEKFVAHEISHENPPFTDIFPMKMPRSHRNPRRPLEEGEGEAEARPTGGVFGPFFVSKLWISLDDGDPRKMEDLDGFSGSSPVK